MSVSTGVRGRVRWAAMLAVAAVVLGTAAPTSATTTPTAPPPGTAQQVSALVGAAPRVGALPATSFPALAAEGNDSVSRFDPTTAHGCYGVGACVFGDRTARRTIVLFGDSHAQMWLPAVSAAGVTLGYRVVLLYLGGCPFAWVTVWNPTAVGPFPAGYYHFCDAFRARAIRSIERLHPSLVLLSNRTSLLDVSPTHYFDRAQWQRGVRTTVRMLRRHVRHVAVIGDVVYMERTLPQCLAAYPSTVQSCSTQNPNLAAHGHEAAERDAAKAAGARFINTLPWVCTARCSPVIGPFLVYLNQAHLDVTYVTYLSRVMTSAVRRVLH